MSKSVTFLFMPSPPLAKCSQSRNTRGPDSGLHPPSPLPQIPEMYKVLTCDGGWGRPRGPRAPPLDPGSGRRIFLWREGGGSLGTQSAWGRQGLPPPALGLGDWEAPCSSWAGGTRKREPSACSLKRVGVGVGTEGASEPCGGRTGGTQGEEGRPWVSQRMG